MAKLQPNPGSTGINKTNLGKHANDPWIRLMRGVIGLTVLLTVVSVLVLIYPDKSTNTSESDTSSTATSALVELSGPTVSADAREMIGLSGVIAKVNAQDIVLTLEDGRQISVRTTPDTVIVRTVTYDEAHPDSEQVISGADLASGDAVHILAKNNEQNIHLAQKIVLSR